MPRRFVLGLWLSVFAVVYGAFYAFGDSMRFAFDASPPCWPAIGIYLAFANGLPRRSWPALAIITLLVSGLRHHTWGWLEIVPWLANSCAVTLGALCLRATGRDQSRPADAAWVGSVFAVAGGLVPVVSATLIKALAYAVHLEPHTNDSWYAFFAADSLGALITAPFFIAAIETHAWREILRDVRGLLADGAILTLNLCVALLVFYGFGFPELLSRTFVLAPCLVLAGFRGRRGLSAIAILAVSLIGMSATFSGHGPIFIQNESLAFITAETQLFLAIITLMIVFLTEAVIVRTTLAEKLRQTNLALHQEIAARRAAEEHLGLAIDATELGVWESRPHTGESFWSDRMRQILALPADAPASPDVFVSCVAPEDRPRMLAIIRSNRSAPDGEAFSDEFRVQMPGGAQRWIRMRGKVFHPHKPQTAAESMVRIAGTLKDITDEVATREALTAANAQAVAANRAKSQFLANMSHEIRSPLTAMLGFADLLLDKATRPDEYRPFAELIKRNGQHLSELIDQILDLSKVESGHLELSRKAFAIREFFADALALMQVKATEKGLALGVEVHASVPTTLVTDALRVRQILLNALSNAIKFTQRGRVWVSVTAEPLATAKDEWTLQIDIADTGIGLSPAEQAHLFQPFTQANPDIASAHGGTGLGLALSRRLARLLGGDFIIHHSEKGVGSVFRATVRAQTPTAQQQLAMPSLHPALAGATRPASLAGMQILLADDFADSRTLVSRFLELAGAHVDCVVNGREAVDQALARAYDVVILDLQMPEIDGMEAARLLRERAFRGPLIALTGRTMTEEVKAALEVGFNAHIGKPINRDVLLSTVQAAHAAPAALH